MNAAVQCIDLVTLSSFLGFAPQHIYYLAEAPERFYITIEIPKNSDPEKTRKLDIPTTELKGVQREILRKILNDIAVSRNVHSYVSGRSILTATRVFCPGRAVLKLDIEDFFPSIGYRRVLGLFKNLGFNNTTAFILSRLVTKGDCLAQGAPTSPMISNLIVRSLDRRLESLASDWELKYIRYSDDLFLHKEKNFNHPRLTEIVYDIVERSGFNANRNKTKYYPSGLPRITLGLLTHGEMPRIPGPQRRRYRTLFFKASRNIHWAHENRAHLRGILEWYKCVHGKDDEYEQYRIVFENIGRLHLHDTYQSI